MFLHNFTLKLTIACRLALLRPLCNAGPRWGRIPAYSNCTALHRALQLHFNFIALKCAVQCNPMRCNAMQSTKSGWTRLLCSSSGQLRDTQPNGHQDHFIPQGKKRWGAGTRNYKYLKSTLKLSFTAAHGPPTLQSCNSRPKRGNFRVGG